MTQAPPGMELLLQRTAEEVRRCRTTVIQLENVIHALLKDGAGQVAPGALADLQGIDLLDQRLADLVLWIDGLAAHAGGHVAVDIDTLISPLRLAEMRQALAGIAQSDTKVRRDAEVF